MKKFTEKCSEKRGALENCSSMENCSQNPRTVPVW